MSSVKCLPTLYLLSTLPAPDSNVVFAVQRPFPDPFPQTFQ